MSRELEATEQGAPANAGLRIHDLPEEQRPRERLLREGATALADAELLAILLGSGFPGRNVIDVAQSLLSEHGLVGLLRAEPAQLMQEKGLGKAKVASLIAAVQLGARAYAEDAWPRGEPFSSPRQVFDRYRRRMGDLTHEEVRVLVLDRQHRIIRDLVKYQGTAHGASVRVAELLRDVIIHQGAAMIVIHNHPSGDPSPSQADRAMTSSLAVAAEVMDIDLLDHVILARDAWQSMAQLGLLEADAASV